jgi:hypothetical protein
VIHNQLLEPIQLQRCFGCIFRRDSILDLSGGSIDRNSVGAYRLILRGFVQLDFRISQRQEGFERV